LDEGLVAERENAIPSVVKSLIEREQGANSGSGAYRPKEIGNRGKSWKTTLNGKNITSFNAVLLFLAKYRHMSEFFLRCRKFKEENASI